WSSDVCSSDLMNGVKFKAAVPASQSEHVHLYLHPLKISASLLSMKNMKRRTNSRNGRCTMQRKWRNCVRHFIIAPSSSVLPPLHLNPTHGVQRASINVLN